ncbi:uncharacterized protein EDB91DRAFT_1082198 [Suillus paluster]|uniref:uncharacterized protein n=1 Tax=Suillus paluster TaxID=48578 RepID=UPI001B85EAC7|nr:uncharacterized protein EDB91DRAFT_1082198 [Suillus paluster]KAG1739809.1 hypothetical protein EDB91DRAFT_1082198 [Suillus paluster]
MGSEKYPQQLHLLCLFTTLHFCIPAFCLPMLQDKSSQVCLRNRDRARHLTKWREQEHGVKVVLKGEVAQRALASARALRPLPEGQRGSLMEVRGVPEDLVSVEFGGTPEGLCGDEVRLLWKSGVETEQRLDYPKALQALACKLVALVDVSKLTPPVVKMLMLCMSHVHDELKMKMQSLTSSFFGFWSSHLKEVVRQNQDLAESLKDWFSICLQALKIDRLNVVLTSGLQGLKEDIKFTSATYASIYQGTSMNIWHLTNSLKDFATVCMTGLSVEALTMLLAASWIGDKAFHDLLGAAGSSLY